MVSQSHGSGKRVGIILPLNGQDDSRWINLAGRRLTAWFGNAGLDLGVLLDESREDERVVPTAIIHSEIDNLTEFAMTRVFGLGLLISLASGRVGVAVAIDDDLIVL